MQLKPKNVGRISVVPPIEPEQWRCSQNQTHRDELSPARPFCACVIIAVKVRMGYDHQWRMSPPLRIQDFAGDVRQVLHLGLAKLLRCVQAIEQQAGRLLPSRKWLAAGGQRP